MEIKMILQMTEVGEGVLSVREHPIMPNVRMLNEGSECQMTKYGWVMPNQYSVRACLSQVDGRLVGCQAGGDRRIWMRHDRLHS